MFRLLRLSAALLFVMTSLIAIPGLSRAAQDETPTVECVSTTPEENEALVQAYWDESVWGPQGKIASVVAPDEIHHWGILGTTQGFDEFAKRWALFNAAFPDLTFQVDEIVATDTMAASVWTATGTQEGEWQGLPPTHDVVSWSGINIFRIACGMIAESWGEADHIGLRAQLGGTDVPPLMQAAAASPAAGAMAEASPCAPATPDETLAVVERWSNEVWTDRKLEVLDEIASPEITHHGASFPDVHGIPDLQAAVQRQFETFPDLVIAVEDGFATSDLAVVRWSGTGTQQGEYFGVPPTGADVTMTGINVYRLECGKIVESWSEMNALDVLNAVRKAAAEAEATPAA